MGLELHTSKLDRRGQLGAQVLAVPVSVRHRLLRHGVHVGRGAEVRHRALRRRVPALLAAPGRSADHRRHDHRAAGPGAAPHLRADVRAQVGDRLRRLRLDRRLLPELLDDAGRRSGRPGRRLHPRLPAAARAGARRPDAAAGAHPAAARATARCAIKPRARRPAGGQRPAPARRSARRRSTRRKQRPRSMAQIVLDRLSAHFTSGEIVETGSQHGDEWARVRRDAWLAVATFLRDDPATDDGHAHRPHRRRLLSAASRASTWSITCYSLQDQHRVRLKAPASPEDGAPDDRDASCPLWAGRQLVRARGLRSLRHPFKGHPDLRRILMYAEFVGHPLRKDYPKEKRQPLVRRQPDASTESMDSRQHACADPTRKVVARHSGRRGLSRRARSAHRADAAQHGPVASGDARHGAHRPRPSRARRSSSADVQIGYLHRCFEKESEHAT